MPLGREDPRFNILSCSLAGSLPHVFALWKLIIHACPNRVTALAWMGFHGPANQYMCGYVVFRFSLLSTWWSSLEADRLHKAFCLHSVLDVDPLRQPPFFNAPGAGIPPSRRARRVSVFGCLVPRLFARHKVQKILAVAAVLSPQPTDPSEAHSCLYGL